MKRKVNTGAKSGISFEQFQKDPNLAKHVLAKGAPGKQKVVVKGTSKARLKAQKQQPTTPKGAEPEAVEP